MSRFYQRSRRTRSGPDFSFALRLLRQAIGFTQKELGKLAGVERQHINRWENGRADMGLFAMLRLCDALRLHPVIFVAFALPPRPCRIREQRVRLIKR